MCIRDRATNDQNTIFDTWSNYSINRLRIEGVRTTISDSIILEDNKFREFGAPCEKNFLVCVQPVGLSVVARRPADSCNLLCNAELPALFFPFFLFPLLKFFMALYYLKIFIRRHHRLSSVELAACHYFCIIFISRRLLCNFFGK